MSDPLTTVPDPAPPRTAWYRSQIAIVLGLLLLSAAVRLALWAALTRSEMSPLFDEASYMVRSRGFGAILRQYFAGHPDQIPERAVYAAYLNGVWPPLHPLLIGLAFAFREQSVAVARFVVLLQSVATTLVVYGLAARLTNRRAAWIAGLTHAVYPSFVAYAQFLWSETTYVLCVLSALYFASVAATAASDGRRWLGAGMTGVCLGLTALTRAAALPLLLIVPIWLVWRGRGFIRRSFLPVAVLSLSCLVAAPWLSALWEREGRFVLLSTETGFNLYLGNNPWVDENSVRKRASDAVVARMRAQSVDRDSAAREMALAYIRADLPGFVKRCVRHARALWVPDWFILRHLLYVVYPPLPDTAGAALFILLTLCFAVLVGTAVYGLCSRRAELRERTLLLACVLLGMGPNVLSIANARMSFPFLAILLIPCAAGVAALAGGRRIRHALAVIATSVASVWLVNPSLPVAVMHGPHVASSHYAGTVGWIDRLSIGNHLALQDAILVRQSGEPSGALQFSTTQPGALIMPAATESVTWRNPRPGVKRGIILRGAPAFRGPLELAIQRGGESVRLIPARAEAWRRWRPTGIEGVEYRWMGATDPTVREYAFRARN